MYCLSIKPPEYMVSDLDQDEEGNLFIAMEYVAGPSLRTILREAREPISAVRALQIGHGVAASLAAAHARGAVHRDIKPVLDADVVGVPVADVLGPGCPGFAVP